MTTFKEITFLVGGSEVMLHLDLDTGETLDVYAYSDSLPDLWIGNRIFGTWRTERNKLFKHLTPKTSERYKKLAESLVFMRDEVGEPALLLSEDIEELESLAAEGYKVWENEVLAVLRDC